MVEDVIFLGAGASKPEGAPLQNDLFKKYFLVEWPKKYERMNNRLNTFFKDFFAINIKNEDLENVNFPNFEEVLGILELALNREESFKDYTLRYTSPRVKQIKKIREDFIFLIASIIHKELEVGDMSYKTSNKERLHKILVERLITEENLLNTSFISLNYDILIDNALVDVHPDYDLDYGINFMNFERENDWKKPRESKAVQLYKPHGSLNWLYCPTCISMELTPKIKEEVVKLIFEPKKCEKCGSAMVPIIIPPTFLKVMSNRYLQEIWYKTEDALKQAKRIFFCGYSFPDADIHIKYLLKRAEINGISNKQIYIVNNHEYKSEDRIKDEKIKYKRFFKSNQVNWTGQSFQDFCKDGELKD